MNKELGYCDRCDIIFEVIDDKIENFNCLCGYTHLQPYERQEGDSDYTEILHKGGPCDRRN